MIRKAVSKSDVDAVERIYKDIHKVNREGVNYTGWIEDEYPLRENAESAFENGTLYVYADDSEPENITASVILNKIQSEEYASIDWQYEAQDDKVFVVHILVVSPYARKQGIAKKLIDFAELLAKDSGCSLMRFDTSVLNIPAQNAYKKFGYREAGVFQSLTSPDERFVCYEKML